MNAVRRVGLSRSGIWISLGFFSAFGTAFILQELVRTWLDVRSLRGAAGPSWAEPGGILHLSGAAWPSVVLNVVGHVWSLIMTARWIRGSAPNRGQAAVLSLLVLLATGVHFLVCGSFRAWVLWPTLFLAGC